MAGRSPLDRVKYAVKWTVAHTLYRLGLLHLYARLAVGRRAVVLTYHRVLTPEESATTWSHPGIIVGPEAFDAQLAALSRFFTVVSLDQFTEALARGSFAGPTCLVTFDDGWCDTFTAAWPALRRHATPAVVFLPVAYIGTEDTFWQERLGHVLFEACRQARERRDVADAVAPILAAVGLGDLAEVPADRLRQRVVDRVRVVKADAAIDTARLLAQLTAVIGHNAAAHPLDRFMTWDEVRAMAAGGITFGAHSESHRIMTRLSPPEVVREVEAPRDRIVEELKTAVRAFSYPNGDWNPVVSGAVRQAGYQVAFSMDRGIVAAGDDRYTVRRINIHDGIGANVPMFLARVLGIL